MMIQQSIPGYQSDEEVKIMPNIKAYNGRSLVGWKDLCLKDQIVRAVKECGFQHPSEVQFKAIPVALNGDNMICQARSGLGKTAVFVISVLQLIHPQSNNAYKNHQCIVICHTRQLAHQIYKDFQRIGRYFKMPKLNISTFFGGIPIEQNIKQIRQPDKTPHIIISTPGRLHDLYYKKFIQAQNCKFFIIDECDKVLLNSKMKNDVLDFFDKTPKDKQVMMFSATIDEALSIELKNLIGNNAKHIQLDDGKHIILHGLTQFYTKLPQSKKFDKLTHLLDTLSFNQVIIFVNRIERAKKLSQLLKLSLFNPICIHSGLKQEERIKCYDLFKANGSRLLVATDLFGRGIDIERVNLVINYDFPFDKETYLHRVGRAGRFGTKGLAINFMRLPEMIKQNPRYYANNGNNANTNSNNSNPNPNSDENKQQLDDKILREVQKCFKVQIKQLPSTIDVSLYM